MAPLNIVNIKNTPYPSLTGKRYKSTRKTALSSAKRTQQSIKKIDIRKPNSAPVTTAISTKKLPGGGIFSTPRCQGSIVCAGAFHFRVRDGNGWVRLALTTGKLFSNYTLLIVTSLSAIIM